MSRKSSIEWARDLVISLNHTFSSGLSLAQQLAELSKPAPIGMSVPVMSSCGTSLNRVDHQTLILKTCKRVSTRKIHLPSIILLRGNTMSMSREQLSCPHNQEVPHAYSASDVAGRL